MSIRRGGEGVAPPKDVQLTATGVVPLEAAASGGAVGIGVEDGVRARPYVNSVPVSARRSTSARS